jgi:RHS repeat-associated protein
MATGGVSYDPAGNTQYDGANQYLYDGDGRICAVANSRISGMTPMTGYIYDAGGNRVAKGSISQWSCDPSSNGFVPINDYVLGPSGEQVSEMGVNSNNAITWQHTNAYAAGKLIATYDLDGLHFYVSDPLGTRRAQTNYAGVVEQTCSSLPFGDAESCGSTPTEHLFTGKERDSESGNDYFGARYYASTMGRFLSPDPFIPFNLKNDQFEAWISNPQHWNKYAYALNNPLKYTDPTGMTETIYYYLNSNLTDAQRKFFNDNKDAILGAIRGKLKEAGITDVQFKDGSSLSKEQVNTILNQNPKGVALLNFVNGSYQGHGIGDGAEGGAQGPGQRQVVVNMGQEESSDASTYISRLGAVGAHEVGHAMGFYARNGMLATTMFWNRDLMNEEQSTPHTWWNPWSWGEEHFDMSIPQNRNAVQDINQLPVYQPQP